jgi:hypothetical protein
VVSLFCAQPGVVEGLTAFALASQPMTSAKLAAQRRDEAWIIKHVIRS